MISAVIALLLRLVLPAPVDAVQPGSAAAVNVGALTIGKPATLAELDLGKLKGELRQVGWSPDDTQLYVQTGEGTPAAPKLHHYSVAAGSGAVTGLEQQPEWARLYWEFKSDRAAPGLGSLMIDVEQKFETMKVGTGQAGALDREASPLGGNVNNIDTVAKGNDQNQKQLVIRLMLLGQAVSEFVNQTPVPGLMFSWGPEKSGAIAFTNADGELTLMDRDRHTHRVAGAKNALLPAWSMDGTRLAWAQKSGRRKYSLVHVAVER